jgi:hypothetical protein
MLPAGVAAQEHAPLLDTTAVQAVLQPDEIVFAFSLSEPNSFRWVISREHFVFDRIAGRKVIESQAVRLRDLHRASKSDDALHAASRQLGGLLFDKISTADDRPLIVVPDGVLHDVPFELLELQGTKVSDRHPVSYAASLDALVQLRRAGKPQETVPVALALGLSLAALLVVAANLRKPAQNR